MESGGESEGRARTEVTIGATDDSFGVTHVVRDALNVDPLRRGEEVGRYVMLARLGAGGMGVVYAAYDPELDRKVALKLLRAPSRAESRASSGQRRLLREAQALAKLSHPNVVAVYDVGEHRGAVWLAMELVAGDTLSKWCGRAPRHWSEVINVMREAGRGVAAAHAAGLVHRDLKPDNIMVGDDGRVRVMDFGLAQGGPAGAGVDATDGMTRRGSVVGTPAYMAPEQHLGLDLDAAADQFSYCVTLWEALYGRRPFGGETWASLAFNVSEGKPREPPADARVPGWVRRVVQRGLAADPRSRWPNMDALLAELSSGRARARRRVALGAVALVGLSAAGGEGWRRWDRAATVAACEAEGARIEEIWNDAARVRVQAGLVATRLVHAPATANKVLPWLDAQALALTRAQTQVCRATLLDGSWDEETSDRATWCLAERRFEFGALADELAQGGETVVNRAVLAAAALSPVAPCVDESALARLPAPPREQREQVRAVLDELSRATALQSSGGFAEGLALAELALTHAADASWPPAQAAARARVGALLERTGRHEEARTAGVDAYFEAVAAGSPDTAALAATTLAHTVGYRMARFDEGLVWGRLGLVALDQLGEEGDPRRAGLLNGMGLVHSSRGDHDSARSLHEQALAIRERVLGPDHPEVAASLNNLGLVMQDRGEFTEAQRYFERALSIKENALGSDHPQVASTLNNLGLVHAARGDDDRAAALYERSLAIREKTVGTEHADVAGTLSNLAGVRKAQGRLEEALRLYERALAIDEKTTGPDHPNVASSLNNVGTVRQALGDHVQAQVLFERALAIRERVLGPDHADVAMVVGNLAGARRAQGAHDEAAGLYARALAIRERALGPDDPRLAYPLLGLGQVAIAQGRAVDALPLLERALRVRQRGEVTAANLAEARFRLAQALWSAPAQRGRDRARAVVLATEAASAYRSEPGRAEDLAEVEAWLFETADRER